METSAGPVAAAIKLRTLAAKSPCMGLLQYSVFQRTLLALGGGGLADPVTPGQDKENGAPHVARAWVACEQRRLGGAAVSAQEGSPRRLRVTGAASSARRPTGVAGRGRRVRARVSAETRGRARRINRSDQCGARAVVVLTSASTGGT